MNKYKSYIIPTKKWIKPLEITYNENNIILNEHIINEIKRENIIIKIQKRDSFLDKQKLENIYNIINKSPHIIKIYNIVNYYENRNNTDILDFCNIDNNINILTLEIMHKYSYSLKNFNNTFSIDIFY